jgi:uncharacterized protein
VDAVANSSWFVPVLAVVMAIGLLSLLTYIIPGLTIIWAAILVYGIVTGFSLGSGILFGFVTLLMVGGNLVDNVLMGTQAKKSGASWLALGAALIGAVAGTILLPPFGGIIGACLGILIVEWIRQKNFKSSLQATGGILTGCGLSVIIRFGIGLVMIALWVAWLLWL